MLDMEIASKRLGFDVSSIEQGSDDWKRMRLGVISASRVGDILTEPKAKKDKEAGLLSGMAQTYLNELVAEICTIPAFDDIPARPLLWGRNHEAAARELFCFEHDLEVKEVPFIYKDESMRIGTSPDGMCSDGRPLEIKCPYTSAQYISMVLGGLDAIKSAYHAQVNFQMYCTGTSDLWFVNFDPRMKKANMVDFLVKRDDEICEKFDLKLPRFIEMMDERLDMLGFKFGDQWGE